MTNDRDTIENGTKTMSQIGLITYDTGHLKTEQITLRLLERGVENLTFYALPFKPRKPRSVLLQHRPLQSDGATPRELAARFGLGFYACDTDTDIEGSDIYLITGAGILSAEAIGDKKILNAHPGIIPASRGLDSFKWAILDGKRLGNSLHYIDAAVDAGDIVTIQETPVFSSDTIENLARRHYEMEITMMSHFDKHLSRPSNPFKDEPVGEPRVRMSAETEKTFLEAFEAYKRRYQSQGI